MDKQKNKNPRRGRPPGRQHELVGIYVKTELKDEMVEYAESTGGTISASLRPILERGWEEFKREQFQQSDLHKYTGDTIMVKEASHDQED